MFKNYFFNIVFLILSVPLWSITGNNIGGMILTIPIMTYSSISIIEQYEELYNYDCILNSLPISRYDIVKSKFKSVFMIYLFNTVLTLAIELGYSMVGVKGFMSADMYILGISLSFLLSMTYGAGAVFIICRFGYGKLKAFGIILMFIIMTTLSIPMYILQNGNYILQVSAVIIALGTAAYFIFQKYTIKIYSEKEF
jgi:hypothetical protein